jgi:hypothetical protein
MSGTTGILQIAHLKSVKMRDVNALIPYVDNPRENDHAVENMAELIKEYGFLVPILVKPSGEILDGHLRLKAALFLGMESVPVSEVDHLSPEQEQALRIAVNKAATFAIWNKTKLKAEIAGLKKLNMTLPPLGFSMSELAPLLPQAWEDSSKLKNGMNRFDASIGILRVEDAGPEKCVITVILSVDDPEYALWRQFKVESGKSEDGAVFRALLRAAVADND